MALKISAENAKLFGFSIFTSVIAYGFTLTNFSLSVDSESPILPDYSMGLGRWGTNLVRYRIFDGHLPYFTLLIGLILLSATAVGLCKLFKFKGTSAYIFSALFLSFPQMAYQLVFTMQADAVPLGFLFSVITMLLFLKTTEKPFSPRSIGLFVAAAFCYMFVIAIYQALVLIPPVIYLIIFLQNTYYENFNLKAEIRKLAQFAVLGVVAALLYYVSVKLLCPPVEGGYLSSYVSGESHNQFTEFCSIWYQNLLGKMFYGNKLFAVATALGFFLIVRFAIERKHFALRFVALLLVFLLPYIMSYFITNGYHPPRIYLTAGIVFAFVITYAARYVKSEKVVLLVCALIFFTNVYFITRLFYSNYRISNHDKEITVRIDSTIRSKYPQFDENVNYVYFYGCIPYEHHNRYRLDNSEIFGGSILSWDNGSNYRIINLFKFNDVAYYKMIDNKEVYLKIKDSFNDMPVWPNPESVKMINDVIVVKLGSQKGEKLWVE
jgi:hypothetical protein